MRQCGRLRTRARFRPSMSGSANALRASHYRHFMYRAVARHWHALWCRWLPDATLKEQFHAERIFVPAETGEGTDMQVVYHYGDERGMREGPQCGPWRITEAEHSTDDGLLHPSSKDTMTTLCLPPGGPAAWCAKVNTAGKPCAVELFIHHGEHLRMSAGVIHLPAGEVVQLSAIREDSRGPSQSWSDSTDAIITDAAGLASVLHEAGAPIAGAGVGHAISGALHQRKISEVFATTRLAAADSAMDVVLLCPDSIAIVAPRQRLDGQPFSSAAAWWPRDSADTPPTRLYYIEAQWDAHGALDQVRHLVFACG